MLPLLLFLTAFPALAQTRSPIPSPFTIRDEIDADDQYDLDKLYQVLKLPKIFQPDGESPINGLNCRERNCKAEAQPITTFAFQGEPTHLLTLCWSFDQFCRIVFFREEVRPKRWSVLGHIDAEDFYGVEFTPTNPFRLKILKVRGTGVIHLFARWYSVDETGIRLILTVQDNGDDGNVRPTRNFKALFVDEQSIRGEDVLTFLYYVRFSDVGPAPTFDAIPLFDERRLVRFVRPSKEGAYKFDPARSEITQSEIDAFFEVDIDIKPAELLNFAHISLLQLARSGNPTQKRWLSRYLSAAPASAIKSELLAALKSSQ